jgi:hypothetical protein
VIDAAAAYLVENALEAQAAKVEGGRWKMAVKTTILKLNFTTSESVLVFDNNSACASALNLG